MARILVLDGHSAAALAFTRSAGGAGHWVSVGANRGEFSGAARSRYCQLAFKYPASTQDTAAFVDALLAFVRVHEIDLIVPLTDWTVQPLSEARARFDGVCKLALAPPAAIAVASDKHRTIQLASSRGIAVPRTWLVASPKELPAASEISLPAVVKDRFSVRWRSGKGVFGSVAYAYDLEELDNLVRLRLEAAGDVLVQEFVAGTGIGFSCFIAQDQVFAPFGWKRIREVDPRGSGSSCRRSIQLDDALAEGSSRLIRAIGFQGIAMVEYKRRPDGTPVLMEINGRPWGSIALPIACGIDYPRLLIEWSLAGVLPSRQTGYRSGITCRRLLGEWAHLRNLHSGKPPKWPLPYPPFWASLLRIAIPWYPGMHYDDLWFSDPRPLLAEFAQKVWKRTGSLPGG